MKKRCLVLLLFISAQFLLYAQEEPSDLLERIQEAVEEDFFDKALDLMEEGRREYPEDFRFPMVRGDLYLSRELYSLALDSYVLAENQNPDDWALRYNIASTLGYLDQNFQALEYLESLHQEGKEGLLDDMGWMYYKTHQPEKGILLIREALENNFDRNLSLTLGTLYSETNEPELCRHYYLEAIHDALEAQDSYFASVGYYNLSLAEKSFYDYDAAIEYASHSLKLMDRSGGHLALGDLNMMRLNFSRVEEEFLKAIELDKTPLSRSNLAALYQMRGLLPEALNQLQKIDENKEKSWMYYYGLNQEQFTLDLYRQFYQVYRGLFQQTKILGEWGFKEKINRSLHVLSYGLKSEYYKILYRIMAFKEGQSQLDGGSALRGSLTLAAAAEGFPPLSDKYYGNAFALEVFPQASPWYDLEIGRERRDISRLQRASETFDPLWEVEALEESFREMALLLQAGKSMKRDDLILRIYDKNPGGLLQYGLRLPLSLKMSGSELSPGAKRKIRRLLKESGFSLRSDNRGIEGRFLTLRINMGDAFAYTLSDNEGSVLISGSEILQEGHSLEDWVLSFRSGVFFP